MPDLNQLKVEDFRNHLRKPAPITHDIPADNLQGKRLEAGVLMPLLRQDNAWHLLFIRRAEFEHDQHSGQVAFAGGKREKTDSSLLATALRETHEEIGIKPQHVQVLGQLGQHHTISNFRVEPSVAVIPWPYPLQLDSREVAHAFTIPLNWLADKSNHELRYRQLAADQEPVPVVYFADYQGELLWGATARMVVTFMDLLLS